MRRIVPLTIAGLLALAGAACDDSASDDLENIEENVEEGASEVGEVIEEGGEEMQEPAEDNT